MKASIIIPTHNRVNSLKKLLYALSKQNYPKEEFEVIVIDNGSTDETYEFLSQFIGINPELNLKIIRYSVNQGAAKAHNDGIKIAKGEIIILLDDDLLPIPSFLRAHIECHTQEHYVGIGNRKYIESKQQKWLARYLSTRGVHKLINKENIPFKCLWTGNTSFRKEDIMKVGLFDEQFKGIMGGEDLELGYRLEKERMKFRYVKEAITYHPLCELDEILEKQRRFGKDVVPLLLNKDPIFYKLLKINVVENPNLLVKIAISQIFYKIIRNTIYFLNKIYIPPIIFDYLIYYNRIYGFKESKFDDAPKLRDEIPIYRKLGQFS
ncbi:MAG: glycosyltransferase [bacterium]|nr:glycosyltransferase [bacterium]